MRQVIFLYNELMDSEYQKKLKLPLHFVSFAFTEGYLYDVNKQYIAFGKEVMRNKRGNNRVYGAIFVLENSEHYMRVLDASLACSKTMLGANHKLDYFHRKVINAIPIHFKSVEDFMKLKYNEKEVIQCQAYFGNIENEHINKSVNNSVRNREMSGVDINNFINLLIKEKRENDSEE